MADTPPRRHRPIAAAAALALVVLVTACGSSSPSGSGLTGIVRDTPLQVGDVVLPEVTDASPGDATGTPFTFRADPGHLLIVYFGYTNCPDLCPTTLAHVSAAIGDLGSDADRVDLAMVTVDPDRDTPAVLTGYLRSFTQRVHAIRTTDLARLAQAEAPFQAQSSVTVGTDGAVDVQHTAITYVVDDAGTVRVEWPFGTAAEDMQHDLAKLLSEQSP
jgi:protein SCO1